jgi:hypothetical protein
MNSTHTYPTLYPPMALLWTGPMPYQTVALSGTCAAATSLSRDELRSIVTEMMD